MATILYPNLPPTLESNHQKSQAIFQKRFPWSTSAVPLHDTAIECIFKRRTQIRTWMDKLAAEIVASSTRRGSESQGGTEVAELTRVKRKTRRPPMYKVLLLNDDFTPMEFVVAVLEKVFQMHRDRAISLMLAVHQTGVGVAGVFTYEIAETKANQVIQLAQINEHPLQCRIEKE